MEFARLTGTLVSAPQTMRPTAIPVKRDARRLVAEAATARHTEDDATRAETERGAEALLRPAVESGRDRTRRAVASTLGDTCRWQQGKQ